MPENYDVIISGAGSAGLSVAIFCARKNMKVLVLERNVATGVFPRGETMRPDPIVDDLLGPGFMDEISFNMTALRRYYSPLAKRSFSLERENASYIFHWADLTEGLLAQAKEAGATVLFNEEVAEPIIENQRCTGVKTIKGSQYFARTIIGAEGYDSVLGNYSGVDYPRLNCPILKTVCQDVSGDYPGMDYFLIPPGTLDYAPDFPPSIAFIFPRGNHCAEVGLILFAGLKGARSLPAPDKAKIFSVYDKLLESYPVFSGRMKNATEEFRGISQIPMAGMHHSMGNVPGLLLMGDAIGLVEASGGCGIVATMKNAAFLSEFIHEHESSPWDNSMMSRCNQTFMESEIVKHVKKKYCRVPVVMELIMGRKRPKIFYDLLWRFGSAAFGRM